LSESNLRGYARDFSRSKSGLAGLVLMILLVGTSIYVLVGYPSNIASEWGNPKHWEGNPQDAPPEWIGYFTPNFPPTIGFPSLTWTNSAPAGSPTYNFSNAYSFTWSSVKSPSNLNFIPILSGAFVEAAITWTKPDGSSLVMYVGNPQTDVLYGVADPGISPWIQQFIVAQTGSTPSSMTGPQEMAALFNQDGKGLLTNPVLHGEYKVRVDMISDGPGSVDSSTFFSVVGKSYGLMGTDLYGRPIQLGVLLGLPWALELGALTSVVAVLFGVIYGGIAGYLGGRRDDIMQWSTLVFLALPALPFLVALSYNITLTIVTEALLIAGLSWPFYAIIARSVSLSVKSQTYVEADRAMGVSSLRTFFTHFMPRLTPVSIAYTALGVPAGILLAQTLAFIGIQPETVVTWGGILDDAFIQQAAVYGWWWWVLFPGVMIIVASLPFVLVGFALDKIVAPKVQAK
jgi:peptide/nickel transport system permease protein